LAKPENPDAAQNLDALYDQAGNPKADASTPAQAGQGPENAAPDLWAQLERQLAVKLKIKLQSGRTRQWAEAAVEFLRNYPATPLEAAMAKALAEIHGLNAQKEAIVRSFVSGAAMLDSLPGVYVYRLVRTKSGLYALTDQGLFILKNDQWKPLLKDLWVGNADRAFGARVLGSRLFISDDKFIYEVRGDRTKVAVEGDYFGTPVWHRGKTYLPVKTQGLYVKTLSGEWKKALAPAALVPVMKMIVIGQDLYAGANRSIYKKTRDGWDPGGWDQILTGTGNDIDIIAHDGKPYAIGYDMTTQEYFPYVLEKNGEKKPIRLPGNAIPLKLFDFDTRLYALTHDRKLYALEPNGWTLAIEEVTDERGSEYFTFGKELYVQTPSGMMFRYKAGHWRRVHENVGTIHRMVEISGKRYAHTMSGLYEIKGDQWMPLLGREARGIAAQDGRLLVGTESGIKQLALPKMPKDWKDGILNDIARRIAHNQSVEQKSSKEASDGYATNKNGDIVDPETGRTIFSRNENSGLEDGK